jgi:hypothetical protein
VGHGALRNGDCRILMLPGTIAMSSAEAKEISDFVENGGIVVADREPGIFDEHGQRLAKSLLLGIFAGPPTGAGLEVEPCFLQGEPASRSMRIFFVCERVPFPPDRGDKITTFNEIRHLSMAHEVHVFCLADGSQDLDNISGLGNYARSVTAVPVTGWRSRLRTLTALFTGEPLSVAAYKEKQLHNAIREQFTALKPDLIMVYSCNVRREFPAGAAAHAICRTRLLALGAIREAVANTVAVDLRDRTASVLRL